MTIIPPRYNHHCNKSQYPTKTNLIINTPINAFHPSKLLIYNSLSDEPRGCFMSLEVGRVGSASQWGLQGGGEGGTGRGGGYLVYKRVQTGWTNLKVNVASNNI